MKRAVQQTLVETTKPTLLEKGVEEYVFHTHRYLTMRRKRKALTLVDAARTLGLIPNPLMGKDANLGATPNALEK